MATEQEIAPHTGRRVAGCRIERLLGSGGMGSVYRGTQELLERPVAIKALSAALAQDPLLRARFTAEARTIARIHHPNVAQIYGMTQEGEEMFLVLELIDGESVSARLKREGAFSPLEAARIALQAARGLEAAWSLGVVHRDVKPANLMITPAGIVKVVDFGIAAEVDLRTDRANEDASGSIPYIAPEQAFGEPVDGRADVYALGVTLWVLLSGRLPFQRDEYRSRMRRDGAATPAELPDTIPEPLRALVRAMTAKAPADRPSSAGEVAESLEAWINSRPPSRWALVADADEARGRGRGDALALLDLMPVVTASGDDALAALHSRGAPTLVVTDLSLPRVDGFVLLRNLRHMGVTPPVIVLTDFGALGAIAVERAEELGVRVVESASVPNPWVASAAQALLSGGPIPKPRVPPPRRDDEAARRRLGESVGTTPDAPTDPELFALMGQVASTLGVAAAMISLVLGDRQHFIAHAGLAGEQLAERGTPIADAFCRHVVQSGAPLVVPDAGNHPAFADNRFVRAGDVGSYVGVPLRAPTGEILGTVCAVDKEPVAFGRNDVAALGRLAERIAERLVARTEPVSVPSLGDEPVSLPSAAVIFEQDETRPDQGE